jgi:hypothetical protein
VEHFIQYSRVNKSGDLLLLEFAIVVTPNLWRKFDAWTVTVFKRKDERFGWCISRDEDGAEFSPDEYESEEEAVDAVAFILL